MLGGGNINRLRAMPLGASRFGRMSMRAASGAGARGMGVKQARGGIHASAGTERRLYTDPATADIPKAKSPGVPTTLVGTQKP